LCFFPTFSYNNTPLHEHAYLFRLVICFSCPNKMGTKHSFKLGSMLLGKFPELEVFYKSKTCFPNYIRGSIQPKKKLELRISFKIKNLSTLIST
jgi:hypothetical protein